MKSKPEIKHKDYAYNSKNQCWGDVELYDNKDRLYVTTQSGFFTSSLNILKKDLKFLCQLKEGINLWYV